MGFNVAQDSRLYKKKVNVCLCHQQLANIANICQHSIFCQSVLTAIYFMIYVLSYFPEETADTIFQRVFN